MLQKYVCKYHASSLLNTQLNLTQLLPRNTLLHIWVIQCRKKYAYDYYTQWMVKLMHKNNLLQSNRQGCGQQTQHYGSMLLAQNLLQAWTYSKSNSNNRSHKQHFTNKSSEVLLKSFKRRELARNRPVKSKYSTVAAGHSKIFLKYY